MNRKPGFRRQAGLVNRCFGYSDLDVCTDGNAEAIRLGHDHFDHSNFNAVRSLDNSVEPECSEPYNMKPCIRRHVIVDVREPSDMEVNEHRPVVAEAHGSIGV